MLLTAEPGYRAIEFGIQLQPGLGSPISPLAVKSKWLQGENLTNG